MNHQVSKYIFQFILRQLILHLLNNHSLMRVQCVNDYNRDTRT